MLIRKFLKRLGHSAVVVENGQEAVDAVQNGGIFDCVLMDVHVRIPVFSFRAWSKTLTRTRVSFYCGMPIVQSPPIAPGCRVSGSAQLLLTVMASATCAVSAALVGVLWEFFFPLVGSILGCAKQTSAREDLSSPSTLAHPAYIGSTSTHTH